MPFLTNTTEPVYSRHSHDPEYHELIEYFVSAMPERRAMLIRQFADSDWLALGETAHKITGAAGGYGFEELSLMTKQLELHCRSKSRDERLIESLMRSILGYINRMSVRAC